MAAEISRILTELLVSVCLLLDEMKSEMHFLFSSHKTLSISYGK